MTLLKKIGSAITKINEKVALVTSFLIYPLIVVIVTEVVARYFLNRPTIFSYDLSWMIFAALVFLGGGYGLQHDVHVSADVIYNMFSPRGKAIIDLFCYPLFFFSSMLGLLYSSYSLMMKAWQFNERSPYTSWNPPTGPIKTVLFISILLLLLQGFVVFFGRMKNLVRRGEEE